MYWLSPWSLPAECGMATALHTMNAKWALTDRRNYITISTAQLCFQFRWFNISHQKQLVVFQYCNWFTLVHIKARSICSCLLWSKRKLSVQQSEAHQQWFRKQPFPLLGNYGNQSEKKLGWVCQLRNKESQRICGILETQGQNSSLLQCVQPDMHCPVW